MIIPNWLMHRWKLVSILGNNNRIEIMKIHDSEKKFCSLNYDDPKKEQIWTGANEDWASTYYARQCQKEGKIPRGEKRLSEIIRQLGREIFTECLNSGVFANCFKQSLPISIPEDLAEIQKFDIYLLDKNVFPAWSKSKQEDF